MKLYDEEELKRKNIRNQKLKKYIILGIIVTIVSIIALIIGILYLSDNPNKITVSFNGAQTKKFDKALETMEIDNQNVLYINISAIPSIFTEYKLAEGEYEANFNSKDSCYIESKDEVAIFKADSDVIYKKDLSTNEYETAKMNYPVIKKGDYLYVSIDGLEKAVNVAANYSEKTKKLTIKDLSNLVASVEKLAVSSGYKEIEKNKLANRKAILDSRAVVMDENRKFGIVEIKNGAIDIVLRPQFDSITYIPQKQSFLIEKDRKFGIYDSTGNTKIDVVYNKLTLIDNENDLYLGQAGNNLYGVIRGGEREAKIPFEYEKIGADISSFKTSGLKTGYVLLGKLIPVQQNGQWRFFSIQYSINADATRSVQCVPIQNAIFDNIGCVSKTTRGTVSNVMVLEDYDIVVVQKYGYYGFMDLQGKPALGLAYTDVYMETASGVTDCYMIDREGKRLNVAEELQKRGYSKKVNN